MRRPSKIMSQHDKVIELLSSGNWICQKTFWDLYMRSPHKRRKELSPLYASSAAITDA
jgi:hypothetical protein